MIPGSANPLLLKSAAAAGGLQIERSLRFNSSDSAYLSKVFGTAGTRTTWTWSGWIKRAKLGSYQHLFVASDFSSTTTLAILNSDDTLEFYDYQSAAYTTRLVTTQVFRDPGAWQHLQFTWDSNNGTSTDRMKIYVNGTRITTFSTATYPSPGVQTRWNNNVDHRIGTGNSTQYLDAYLANIHFIDGQALTPSSFTETDATTGQLIPKTYSGSYGTNGFNLLFADNSSNTASTLGKDSSGNSNNFTPNNLSVTAGAGNDSLVDSPVNGSQSDTGVGGEVRGNYCTLNPLDSGGGTVSNGNLEHTYNSSNLRVKSTISIPATGKWYAEFVASNAGGGNSLVGIATGASALTGSNWYLGNDAGSWGLQIGSGTMYTYHNGGYSSFGTANNGDVIGVAVDRAAGKIWWSVNNTWIASGDPANGTNARYSNVPATDTLFFALSNANSSSIVCNWGQRAFAYTAPSGFKALNTANLPATLVTKSNTVMDVVTYTGTGASLTPTSLLGFNPDWIWIKSRSAGTDHALYDVVRGAQARLESNTTDAEVTTDGGVTAFNSAGFTLGTLAQVNTSAATYVAWCWDAGTSTVSNTAGSITSQVRANATAGFSVVTWTATNGAATIGHGLGVAPTFIIVKDRDSSTFWQVYHISIGNTAAVSLNSTNASSASINQWNNTSPTSTVFSVGLNSNYLTDKHVAYCFTPVVGYSSFGSYTGNGSTDGPFVYTGFRPKFIMVKSSTGVEFWVILDSARDPYNGAGHYSFPNHPSAEGSGSLIIADLLSNGFKLRYQTADVNTSSGTYIYAAFAEAPINYSRAR